MYGTERERVQAAQQYKTQLESKAVLSLVATGTYLYNMLVPISEEIKLEPYPRGFSKEQRGHQMSFNWKRLHRRYNYARLKDPKYNPMNMEEMLIKYWWMAYHQLPKFNQSGDYLNWNHFIDDLKQLSTVIKYEQESTNNGQNRAIVEEQPNANVVLDDMPQLLDND